MASSALKALLGVLAVAGYQNRDKIGELLNGLRNPSQLGPDGQPQSGGGLGDLLGGLAGSGGGLGGLGGLLGGGTGGGWTRSSRRPVFVDRTIDAGNIKPAEPHLPAAVDDLTPAGRLPADEDESVSRRPGMSNLNSKTGFSRARS